MKLPFYYGLLRIRRLSGIRKKIIASFVAIFVLILPPVISQSLTGIRQVAEYRAIIDNIGRASAVNTKLKTEIEPIVWDIVAGKVKFPASGIRPLISDIKSGMEEIRLDYYSRGNRTMLDVVLRTMSTLESYIDKLELQALYERPVAEHEATLEEIRAVTNLIADLMQSFISRQMNEVSVLNERISRRNRAIFILDILLLAVAMITGFFAVWAISGDISRPIEKLRRMAAKIAGGDFHSRVSVKPDGELSELADSMNSMAKQIELLIRRLIEEERNLKLSEMKTLQAQITPHFLYNTLDAIIWAAESDRSADVIKLVAALSSFFRITLSHGVDFIPLRDEMLHVENYLLIQQMRYSDILSYSIEADPEIQGEAVLKLLLQPLAENALYHGLRSKRGRGMITVSAKASPGGMSFRVSDTGAGMPPDKLEEVRAAMRGDAPPANARAGFGLFNVNRRLELYYGAECGLRVESGAGGSSVSFDIPRRPPRPARL
jgi:two-component system sensor histidine kinase YesM